MQRFRLSIIAACLVTGMSLAGACSQAPEPSDNANRALKNANFDDVKVDWDKDARVAHLKGTVDRPVDRQRAEDVAAAAVGTSGRVLNEVTVRNLDEKTADDLDGRITSDLKKRIDEDPQLRDRDISFEVNNGVVTVKGAVQTAQEKQHITSIVKSNPDVKDMANRLEIKPRK